MPGGPAYLALALVGVSLLVLGFYHLRPHRSVAGDFGMPATSTASTAPRPVRQPSAGRAAGARPVTPHVTAGVPVRIRIPALHVDAAVTQVSSVGGTLAVPDDPMTVGWWTGAAEPGSPRGSVVLDGHVDSASRGIGAFFYLTSLRAGDSVTLTTSHGREIEYHVTARHTYVKQAGLPAALFASDGPPHLVLITCGGPFDRSTRSYRDNVVVFASPTVR